MQVKHLIAVIGVIAAWIWELLRAVVRGLTRRWFAPLFLRRLENHVVGRHAGISIVSLAPDQTAARAFLGRTVEAMDLVRSLDRLRFGRLQRHLKYVLCDDSNPSFTASYDDRFGICRVNFRRLDFERYSGAAPYMYAAILVHEATHGAIANGEIPLADVRHGGREYFCDAEAASFLRHFNPEVADIWMKNFHGPARGLGPASKRRKHKNGKANPEGGARNPLRPATSPTSAAGASRRSP